MIQLRWTHVALLFAVIVACMNSRAAYTQQTPAATSPAEELVERTPQDPGLPTIFIVGDSTADYHLDPLHEGIAASQGWGIFLGNFIDPRLANVVNAAQSGRSSRTYIKGGSWEQTLAMLKSKDIVLIQLGQNDIFPINDATRARGTLPGVGPETQQILNGVTHKPEIVHTYGWYLRQIVQQARAKGAQPILLSLTSRNVWKDGHVEVGVGEYRAWIQEVAQQEQVDFLDVSAIMAVQYQKLGQDKVVGLYHAKETVHMTTPGAYVAAQLIVSGLKSLPGSPITRYLSRAGRMVTPADAD